MYIWKNLCNMQLHVSEMSYSLLRYISVKETQIILTAGSQCSNQNNGQWETMRKNKWRTCLRIRIEIGWQDKWLCLKPHCTIWNHELTSHSSERKMSTFITEADKQFILTWMHNQSSYLIVKCKWRKISDLPVNNAFNTETWWW